MVEQKSKALIAVVEIATSAAGVVYGRCFIQGIGMQCQNITKFHLLLRQQSCIFYSYLHWLHKNWFAV